MGFVIVIGAWVVIGSLLWLVVHTAVLSALRRWEKERKASAEGTKIL